MSTPKRAAIIGCGDIWVNHRDAIADNPGIELVGVADVEPDRREAASREAGVPGFDSVESLLDSVEVDVVHVCTPHDQHLPVSLAALERGVSVLQEKPLATTISDGLRLCEAAQTATDADGRTPKFGVCYQNRYNSASVRARELVDAGALGELTGGYASCVWTRTADYYAAKPWRASWKQAGGGLLINQAIHTLDLLQWLLGGVDQVHGKASQLKFAGITEVEDTAVARFDHPQGRTSTFFGSLAGPVMRDVEVEIVGSRGRLVIRNGLSALIEGQEPQTVAEPVIVGRGRNYWGHSHALLIDDFYARLDDPEPFWIGPQEAMPSLRMVKSIQEQSPELYPVFL